MKKITFINKPKQLYYYFKASEIEPNSIRVYILLKTPTYLYYDKDKEGIKKNIIDFCFINKKDIKLIENIMKSNTIAIQHLKNEVNKSVADLAQIKVSYGSTIKKWNPMWKIVN